jgi:hypothetical protein
MKQKIPELIAGVIAAAICAVGLYLGSMLPLGKWVAALLSTFGAIDKATANAAVMANIVVVLMPVIFVSVGVHLKLLEMFGQKSDQTSELNPKPEAMPPKV